MTVATTTRKTTQPGNAINTNWNFAFAVRSAADLQVYLTDASGAQTLLASNLYSVALNPIPAGQLWAQGGNVTYPLTGAAVPAGSSVTVARNVPFTQTSSLINQGGYSPQTTEQALDLLAMGMQQINETIGRSITIPVSSSASAALADPALYAGLVLIVNATGTGFTYAASAGAIAVPVSIAQGGTGQASAVAGLDALDTHGADIPAVANLNLDAATGRLVTITGNTGITGITLADGKQRMTRFTGTPLITNGASLVLPGGANIQVAAGDIAIWRGYPAGVVYLAGWLPANQRVSSTLQDARSVGRNIAAKNNAATPNTKLDISADELVLRDANGAVMNVSAVAVTIDFGAAVGANGPDAGGAQTVGAWSYGWVIAKPDGTVAGLGSASATAPTMPAGYTFKALVTAIPSQAGPAFKKYRQQGNEVFYTQAETVLGGGAAAVETAVSTAGMVPPIAHSFKGFFQQTVLNGANPTGWSAIIRVISGLTIYGIHQEIPAAATFNGINSAQLELPNVSQNFYYLEVNDAGSTGSASLIVNVNSFKLPIGGK